jgi:hypothetical protein
MSLVIDNSATYSSEREPISLRERAAQLLYGGILLLAFTTLYAMAETRSLESRTTHYLPPADLHAAPLPPEGVLTQRGMQ